MAGPVTTNYSWQLPLPGGDAGSWGDQLNAVFTTSSTGVDAIVKAISVVANAALPVAGGTMTGLLTMEVVRETFDNVAASEIDWATANAFSKSITGNVTFTFANLPGAGVAQFISVRISSDGSHALTWPTVKWHNGSAPVQTASGEDMYVLYCEAGTVYGARCLEDVS